MDKKLRDMDFNEMVDDAAGVALIDLVQGGQWRTIIWKVCNEAVSWRVQHKDKKK